jgi:hypothetical protein
VSATSSEKKENLLATTKGKWDENIHSTERKSEGANSAGAQQELKSTDRFSFGLRRTWTIAVAGRMLEFFVVRSCRPGVRSRRLGGDCTRVQDRGGVLRIRGVPTCRLQHRIHVEIHDHGDPPHVGLRVRSQVVQPCGNSCRPTNGVSTYFHSEDR